VGASFYQQVGALFGRRVLGEDGQGTNKWVPGVESLERKGLGGAITTAPRAIVGGRGGVRQRAEEA
jgi:hypothetical protein